MFPDTAPTDVPTEPALELVRQPDAPSRVGHSCPFCSEPIRNPAGYVQLLAYQAAIGSGAMTPETAAALLLREEPPPDAAA